MLSYATALVAVLYARHASVSSWLDALCMTKTRYAAKTQQAFICVGHYTVACTDEITF